MCRGERSFLNMQEQAVLFNLSLWLYAVFVSADAATSLGQTYLFLRSLYPIIWMTLGGENGWPGDIGMLFTFPQYGINLFMALSTVAKLNYSVDLVDYFLGYKALGVFAVSVSFLMGVVMTIMQLNAKVFSGFFGKKKK